MSKYTLGADTLRHIATEPYAERATGAEFDRAIKEIRAEAWDEGYTSGHSRAMRRMSDEPSVAPAINPYREEA